MFVPEPGLRVRPSPPAKGQPKNNPDLDVDALTEAVEDWDLRTESLFEWIGMACLGAQRYAVYTPPQSLIKRLY